jgi:PAS domain S-box-containing protein
MHAPAAILVVDDRPENLLAIASILEAPDRVIVQAGSGHEALRRLLEQDFAVILIDVVMPGMDGFELATLIKERERTRHTPIIFLTAGGVDVGDLYRGYSIGAVDYLVKPLDADVLAAKVAIFVELFRKDRRIAEQNAALHAAQRRESEQRYHNLAEAIPHIVWTAAPGGALTYVNERWTEYTGKDLASALGWGWMAAVHPEDVGRCAEHWCRGLATRAVFELECRLRAHDGRYGWHLCRGVPELDADGAVIAWLGTYTDCDQLRRACAALELAVRARDEFLSVASHELRTPLTTLQVRLHGLGDALAPIDDATQLPVVQRSLDSSLRQTSRLIGLVENLLDVSRLTKGEMVLRPQRYDLAAAVREVVDTFAELARGAGVVLEVLAPDPVIGSWDRLRVDQIVQNLVANAIKYAPDAPVTITVDRQAEIPTITVRDRGPGIPPGDLERIFEPYERGEPGPHRGGLGLGLYVVRLNAAAHGGEVRVTSTPGDGAQFVVTLPGY